MINLTRFAVRTIAVLLPACALPLTASAQAPAEEPSRSLRLYLSTFGGYDTDVSTAGFGSEAAPSATHAGARASLRHQIRTEKIAFGANGSADMRYYATEDPLTAASYNGNAVFSSDVTSRLNISTSVNAMYSPRFVFSVLPAANDIDLDLTPALDYGITQQRMVSYAAGATVRFQVSRRSFVNASASGDSTNLLDENYDVRSRSYGAGYSHTVTRNTTLRAGYREQISDYPLALSAESNRYIHRSYDVGVNYSRPLSVSRRTTLSFGTGSAAYENNQETYYTVTGSASLRHQLRRTWEANAAYARGLSVVGGFTEPFFADAVKGNIRGHMTRAVSMIASAGFSNGNIGLGSAANDFDSMQATVRVEWINRTERLGVYGNYFYHAYRFEEPPPSVMFLPGTVKRQGVSAGVTYRIPLIRERTTRVTR